MLKENEELLKLARIHEYVEALQLVAKKQGFHQISKATLKKVVDEYISTFNPPDEPTKPPEPPKNPEPPQPRVINHYMKVIK